MKNILYNPIETTICDEELVTKIVNEQISAIITLHQFKNNPLAISYPKTYRQKSNVEWQEAISRNLHHRITNKIKKFFEINDNLLP